MMKPTVSPVVFLSLFICPLIALVVLVVLGGAHIGTAIAEEPTKRPMVVIGDVEIINTTPRAQVPVYDDNVTVLALIGGNTFIEMPTEFIKTETTGL